MLLALVDLALLVYAVIDIAFPSVAIRWQARSTDRAQWTPTRDVGEVFGRWMGIDPRDEPWSDPVVKRRFRLLGLVLMIAALAGGLATFSFATATA